MCSGPWRFYGLLTGPFKVIADQHASDTSDIDGLAPVVSVLDDFEFNFLSGFSTSADPGLQRSSDTWQNFRDVEPSTASMFMNP